MTKEDKDFIIQLLKSVDAKKLDIDHNDPKLIKWFRFGSYNGLRIACEIIKNIPEIKNKIS